jgi:MscS family membrane protein
MMQTLPAVMFAQAAAPPDSPGNGAPPAVAGQPEDQVVDLASAIGEYFGPTISNTPWTGWLMLLVGIFGGLLVGKIASHLLRGAASRMEQRRAAVAASIVRSTAGPVSFALFVLGLAIGLGGLYAESNLQGVIFGKIIPLLYICALGAFLYNLVDLVDVALRRVTRSVTGTLVNQLIPLVRKALRLFLVVVMFLFVAENFFGANITTWLAGLGIAGLAVSLAAQDSIKNIFGSITVLLDRPFLLGDRITFNGTDGVVESISFRSTKVRTLTGHLVTIPNMKFIDGQVENIAARPSIRRTLNVTITYDTPPEKVIEAVQILKRMLAEPWCRETFDETNFPPRVFFNDFNAASLNIQVNYWYQLDATKSRDWWTFQAHAHEFNMRLLRAYNEAGIDFAFPTQTLHLAGDPKRELAVRVVEAGRS